MGRDTRTTKELFELARRCIWGDRDAPERSALEALVELERRAEERIRGNLTQAFPAARCLACGAFWSRDCRTCAASDAKKG